MATWDVTFYPYNILELSTVTATGDGDSGFPESRLYDLDGEMFWKQTGSSDVYVDVDQAAGVLDVDFLAIPKHNLYNLTLKWRYGDNGVDFSDQVADWVQGDYNQIIKTGTTRSNRYWRFHIVSPTNPIASEVYMSAGYTFNPLRDRNPFGHSRDNVQRNRTIGGVVRTTKRGDTKRIRKYNFWLDNSPDFANFLEMVDYLDDYSKPFYFKDHRDEYFLALFENQPEFDFNHNTATRVSITVGEI